MVNYSGKALWAGSKAQESKPALYLLGQLLWIWEIPKR